jgi:hypothetical protein
LLAQEVRVARPTPQTPGNETALGVCRRPPDVRPRPFVRLDDACVLVRLERVLLVVRGKLQGEVDECQGTKDIVRSTETGGLLEDGDVRRDAEKEEYYILDNSYEIFVSDRINE